MSKNINQITKNTKAHQANSEIFKNTDGLSGKELAIKMANNFELMLPGSRVIYITETGSQVQGTSKEEYINLGNMTDASSDFDAKAIYIPAIESVISGDEWAMKTIEFNSNTDSKNASSDIDMSFIPIGDFLKKISNGMEANAIEILFSMFREDTIIYQDSVIIPELKSNYKKLLFNETRALTGFAISQANKYSVKGDRLRELQTFNEWFTLEVEKLELSKNRKKNVSINVLPLQKFIEESGFEFIKVVHIEHSGVINPYVQILGKEFIFNLKISTFEKSLSSRLKGFGGRVRAAALNSNTESSIEFKAFAHAVRALHQAKELIETGFLKLPTPNAKELMKIKFGEILDKEILTNRLDKLDEELKILVDSGNSKLPAQSDANFVKKIKLMCYDM